MREKEPEIPRDLVRAAPGRAASGKVHRADFRVDTGGVTACLLDVEPVGQELEYWCWAATTQMMLGYLRRLDETALPPVDLDAADVTDISQGRQMNRRLGDSEVDCCQEKGVGFDYESCDRGGWPYYYEFEEYVDSTKWGARRHVVEEHGLELLDCGPRLRVRRRLSDAELRGLAYGSGREFKKRLDDAEGCALSWEMLTALLDARRPVAFAYRYPRPGGGHMRLAVGYVVTPGDKRWVAVADSLPPLIGEVHLIPYEYYRDGPFGGHWRDYWVTPAEEGWPTSLRRQSRDLRVGRELVASYITYARDWEPKEPSTGGQWLSDEDLAAAYLEARAGLLAVEAISSAAEPMAARLGMGGAAGLLSELFSPRAGGGRDLRDVEPGNLEIEEQRRIPVYELTRKELEDWSPGYPPDVASLARLLDRPREVIYEITRRRQRPLDFFAAITVRREDARWKISSLGKTALMGTLAGRQAGEAFGEALVSGGVERLARLFLAADREVPAEELAEVIESARIEDERTRRRIAEHRADEIAFVRRVLQADPAALPRRLWQRRDARGPDVEVREGWEKWVEVWADVWRMIRDAAGRERCRELAGTLPEKSHLNQIPVPLHRRSGGFFWSQESLLDLVAREAEIVRLCSEWSAQDSDQTRDALLAALLVKCYEQEIAWLERRFSPADRERLEEILDWRKLAEDVDAAVRVARPKYILRVRELYQELIAFPASEDRESGAALFGDRAATDRSARPQAKAAPQATDELTPVYPTSFHRPERAVREGSLMEVLLDLQNVAKGIAARR